jgi:SAM-dependent methyltransferase
VTPAALDPGVDRFCIKAGYRHNAARSYDREQDTGFWSAERLADAAAYQRPVYQLARDLLRARVGKNVLDVGSGPGTKLAELFAPICRDLVLIDHPSLRALVDQHLPDAQFVAADLDALDVELGRRFDLIVCADVLEHLAHPDDCARFIREHLADGGRAVLSTPERDHLRGRDCMHSPHPDHVREWNAAEFRSFLERCGLAVERQMLVPHLPLRGFERVLHRIFGPIALRRRWASCQIAVCHRSGSR